MASDLHIHIAKDVPEEQVREYTRHFMSSSGPNGTWKNLDKDGNELHYDEDKIFKTSNIWIGEVSWLKAMIFKDSETFIPSPVQKISDLVGNHLPVIDDAFIQAVMDAFELENDTGYDLNKPAIVKGFLEAYKGEKAFQISW